MEYIFFLEAKQKEAQNKSVKIFMNLNTNDKNKTNISNS